MRVTDPSSPPPRGIHRASRRDQRYVRAVLADLREGECSPLLDRIAAGPLGWVIRFLAGARLTFIFVGWEGPRLYAFGSPEVELVTRLGLRVLGEDVGDAPGVPGGIDRVRDDGRILVCRAPWVEAGVDQIIEGLHARDLLFVLVWELPGTGDLRVDCSVGVGMERAVRQVQEFLGERLGVDLGKFTGLSVAGEVRSCH